MANVNSSRLSPTELRRKLLSLPSAAEPTHEPPVALDETPLPLPRPGARRATDTMVDFTANEQDEGMELNTITLEQLGAARLGAGMLPPTSLDFTPHRREPDPALNFRSSEVAPAKSSPNNEDVNNLRAKNEELRRIIEEMKPIIQEATDLEQRLQDKERALLAEIANRDEQIQALQEHLRLIEEQIASAAPPAPKTADELDEWADELEQESARLAQQRRDLDRDRKQMRDDEESLEAQMRQMEVQMARERAMMARQETELKRLSAEITHELEIMQRGDGALREQLAKFQRRHQDVLRGSSPAPSAAPIPATPIPPAPAPTPAPQQDGSKSALYRMFRRNK